MERIQIDLIDMRHSTRWGLQLHRPFWRSYDKVPHIISPERKISKWGSNYDWKKEFLLMLDHPTSFILIMVESLTSCFTLCLTLGQVEMLHVAAYTGEVKINKSKVVSVRQAALEINAANRFTVNRCKCKGKCNTAQCSCIRSHISCSNHCHPGSKCENNKTDQKQKCEQHQILSDRDSKVLESGWLTDEHMLMANNILKKDYPSVDGLQDTLLQQKLFMGYPFFWICSSCSCRW